MYAHKLNIRVNIYIYFFTKYTSDTLISIDEYLYNMKTKTNIMLALEAKVFNSSFMLSSLSLPTKSNPSGCFWFSLYIFGQNHPICTSAVFQKGGLRDPAGTELQKASWWIH